MVKNTDQKKPVKREDIILGSEQASSYIFSTRSGFIYTLNGTALSILQLCDGDNTLHDIAEHITEKYDVNKEEAIIDVEKIINELLAEGLIRV